MRKFELTIKTDYFCELDLDGFPYTVLKKHQEQVIEVSEGKHIVKLKWTSNRSIFVEQEIDVFENTIFNFSFEDHLLAHPEILKTDSDFFYCLYNFPKFKAIWDAFDSFDLDGVGVDLDDIISATKDGVKVLVDRLGREQLDNYYVIKEGDKYGYAHGWNRVIIQPTYSLPLRDILNYNSEWYDLPYEQQEAYENEPQIPYHKGLAYGIGLVHIGDKWGFIDFKKDNSEPLLFDFVGTQDYEWRSSADVPVKKDGMWGIYNLEKREIVVPCKYERIYRNNDSGYIYETSGKYGYIDHEGKVIIEAKYDQCEPFIDGVAFVKLEDNWGIIDREGKQIYPFELDLRGGTSYGYTFLVKNDKWGVINNHGYFIIPLEYDKIGTSEGLPFWYDDIVDGDTGDVITFLRTCTIDQPFDHFIIEKDGLLGVMSLEGEELLPCMYDAKKYDMRELTNLLSNDGTKISPSEPEVKTNQSEVILLSPDFYILQTKEGWRICKSDGEYLNDEVYEECVVRYGKVSVLQNGFYREIRRTDAKLVGYYMPYAPMYGDDNGVGTPNPIYKWDRDIDDECYWVNGYDFIADCYGNLIYKP